MTKEEKQLLLKDICARLTHRINVLTKDNDKGHIIGVDDIENGVFVIHIIEDGDSYSCDESIENFKPYLRPMSSMTDEEKFEYINSIQGDNVDGDISMLDEAVTLIDFFNSHHFDYRGLIDKGLALEAPEGMYKFL